MLKNKIRMLAVLMTISASISLCACQKQEKETVQEVQTISTPQNVNYDIVKAETADLVVTSQGEVYLEFPKAKELCWEVPNTTMKECFVEKGQEVKAGDVLMSFEVEYDKIALEELEIQLLRKQQDYARKKDVMEIELAEALEEAEEIENGHSYRIAILNVEKQRIEYEQYVYETQKAIAALEEQIAEKKEMIQSNSLVAPFDGVIGSVVYYSEGDDIEVGEALVSIYKTDTIIMKVYNADGKLRYNMDVTVKMSNQAKAEPKSGRVISAGNVLSSNLDQDFALIALDEEIHVEDYGYRGGFIGRGFESLFEVEYQADSQQLNNVLLVNKDAVQREEGKNFVYLLEDGVVHKRYVSLGLSNKTSVWILDGLSEGQELILD